MDDRELEARLRERLRDRFDDAQPSPELAATVRQAMATSPRRVALGVPRARPIQLGWVVAAVAVVALVAIVAPGMGRYVGPGAETQSPVPATRPPATSRGFVVTPAAGPVPSKADSSTASDVLAARLRALGFGTFSSSGGYGIVFDLPLGGASDDTVRAVLSATGAVSFVPLPTADYGEGKLSADVGKPLPKSEPALFTRDDVVSITPSDHNGQAGIDVALSTTAAAAFADYTAKHVGTTFAIVIDRVVALLPTINEPIPGGTVTISGASDDPTFAGTTAILVGGQLPDSWAEPRVPVILSADEIAALVERDYNVPDVGNEQLDVIREGPGFRAVWRVTLAGPFAHSCPAMPVGGSACPDPTGDMVLSLDATTGMFVSEAPA